MRLMNYFKPSGYLILFLTVLLLSCGHERTEMPGPPVDTGGPCPPKSQGDMWTCHHTSTWDITKAHNALIGKWEWKYSGCYWKPEDAGCDSLSAFKIEFTNENKYIVEENGQMIQNGSWVLTDGDSDLFKLQATPAVSTLYGRILFCDDIVEFNDSYIDGCDNYFRRKE